jgi:hypothetical protein
VQVASIGEFERKQFQARSVRLGETEFKHEPVSVVGGGSGYAFDGLMSPAALGIRRVAIDIGRGELEFGR